MVDILLKLQVPAFALLLVGCGLTLLHQADQGKYVIGAAVGVFTSTYVKDKTSL